MAIARWLAMAQEDEALLIGLPDEVRPDALRRTHEFYSEPGAPMSGAGCRYLDGLPRPPREWRIRPLTRCGVSLSTSGDVAGSGAGAGAAAGLRNTCSCTSCAICCRPTIRPFWHEVELRFLIGAAPGCARKAWTSSANCAS